MKRTIDHTPRPPVYLAHVVIRCKHFKQTLDWYKTVLVAKEVFVNDFIAFVTYDDEHHRIALVNIGVEADDIGKGAGVDHVAFGVENVAALMNHYSRLKGAGIEPVWSIHHGGTLSLYYADPEGVRSEFQVEAFSTMEQVEEFMESGAFAANPIGIEFDPDKVLERYLNGESDQQLLDQSAL